MVDKATTGRASGRPVLSMIGRASGVVGAFGAAVLWVLAIWLPSAADILASWSVAVAVLMLIVALLALMAAINGHGNFMLAMFLAAFLPIGAFLLYADHWLRWVGVFDLILFAGAMLTRYGRPRIPMEEQ
jgi:hypothetical protein